MMFSEDYTTQNQHFEQFVQDFVQGHETPQQKDIDKFIQEIKTLERYAVDSKRFYILFDHSKFYAAYISANLEKEAGYSIDYILKQGLLFWFQKIHWKQLTLAYKFNKWGLKFQKECGIHIPSSQYEIWICGIKFKNKWNRWKTYLLKQRILTNTKKNQALLSFIEVEDISSFYKADFAWYRPTCIIDGKRLARAYFSHGSKKEFPDILSERETEILKLAAQQKSNQEISELLEISKNTVERHRKNMIARVGVTDMTALLRIGRILKII